ncbi:hypothetical protein BS78_04G014400 [Paspalum vaginatum]|nr:hypothetical protein BS78_04G014400 [Paspalum vaginatum]
MRIYANNVHFRLYIYMYRHVPMYQSTSTPHPPAYIKLIRSDQMEKMMGSTRRKATLILLLIVVLTASLGEEAGASDSSCGNSTHQEGKCNFSCFRPGHCNGCCKQLGFSSGECFSLMCSCCDDQGTGSNAATATLLTTATPPRS